MTVIKADFLIRNIDDAFEQWYESPWAQHVGFKDFCEFILPYKATELQPINSWRKDLKGLAPEVFDDLQYCDQYKNLTLKAAEEMNRTLLDTLKPQLEKTDFSYPVLRLTTRVRIPSGTCRDYSAITASAMRAQGIQ